MQQQLLHLKLMLKNYIYIRKYMVNASIFTKKKVNFEMNQIKILHFSN